MEPMGTAALFQVPGLSALMGSGSQGLASFFRVLRVSQWTKIPTEARCKMLQEGFLFLVDLNPKLHTGA